MLSPLILLTTLVSAATPLAATAVPADAIFPPLELGLVRAAALTSDPAPAHAALAIIDGMRPLCVARGVDAGPADTFQLGEAALARVRANSRLSAWLIPSDATPVTARHDDIPLAATLDTLAPAASAGWVDVGTRHGVQAGDCLWLFIARQPAARLDVVHAADNVAYTRIVPLATNLRVTPGVPVHCWTAPADATARTVRSAVAHVARESGDTAVWVAAVPGIELPAEPHVDFFRAGRWVGHGLIQRGDGRFWYVGLISEPDGAPLVGDEARIRSRDEIAAQRFAARVFERTEKGYVIDAGEQDGLTLSQSAMAYRGGVFLTRVEIAHVQHIYSIVSPVDRPGQTPVSLQIADEIRLTPPPAPPTAIGTIVSVTDDRLVTVQLNTEAALDTVLVVESGRECVALVALLATQGGTAIGYIIPRTAREPLGPGMTVLRPALPGVRNDAASRR